MKKINENESAKTKIIYKGSFVKLLFQIFFKKKAI